LGGEDSVHDQPWPQWDEALVVEQQVEIVVQINGKIKERLVIAVNAAEEEVKEQALALAGIQAALEGKTPRKTIYVPGRLFNIVV
jgi:leucyl-tRNA synthetase